MEDFETSIVIFILRFLDQHVFTQQLVFYHVLNGPRDGNMKKDMFYIFTYFIMYKTMYRENYLKQHGSCYDRDMQVQNPVGAQRGGF